MLPAIGLTLFLQVTCTSVQGHNSSSRYFWEGLRILDSEPLNQSHSACKSGIVDCQMFGPDEVEIEPRFLSKILPVSAAPAFFIGGLTVEEFAWRGVSEIPVFFVVMPLLVCGWFYLVGSTIDKFVE